MNVRTEGRVINRQPLGGHIVFLPRVVVVVVVLPVACLTTPGLKQQHEYHYIFSATWGWRDDTSEAILMVETRGLVCVPLTLSIRKDTIWGI